MADPPDKASDDARTLLDQRYFLLRVLLLVGLFGATDLWLVRHTGYGLRDPRVIGGVGGLVFVAFWLAEKVIASADEVLWKDLLRKLARIALNWRPLAALYVVAGFLMLNLSSIVVITDEGTIAGDVTVETLDSEGQVQDWLCERGDGPWRFCVWTGPFGSSYRVSVRGYLPRSVDVYPLTGLKLRPGEDLRRSPTVLIRPPFKALDTLSRCDDAPAEEGGRRCGHFTLCKYEDTGCKQILADEGYAGSFLVGWPQAVPRGLVQDWQFELTVQGTNTGSPTFADTILKWKNFKSFVPGSGSGTSGVPPLTPGTRLRAEVRSKSREQNLVACKIFVIENVAFMDIAMESTLAQGACPP